MCPRCDGLGRTVDLDTDRLVDPALSLNEGAIRLPSVPVGSASWQLYAQSGLFDPDLPVGRFSDEERRLLLHGHGFTVARTSRNGTYRNQYEGLARRFTRLYLNRDHARMNARDRAAAADFTRELPCPECGGARLNAAALASRLGGRTIADLCALEVGDLIGVLEELEGPAAGVAAEALEQLRRIRGIGLGYLALDRATASLSGGEAQRLKTVRHLGSSLTGLTYIFDEPSTGLHPADVRRLLTLLRALRDQGNTVLVVEHDRDVIAAADHVVDLGPGAGAQGGRVVFEGTPRALAAADTPTGAWLRRPSPLTGRGRTPTGWLAVTGARLHNLAGVDVDVPRGVLTVVTGVAGSGKSTLAARVLPAQHPGTVVVDQAPIAAAPRASVATHLKIMDAVRRLFARANGVDAALFSANSAGACPACSGRGSVRTDLAFMDPVTTVCEACAGGRFGPQALGHRLRGLDIVQVGELSAEEGAAFFTEEAVAAPLRRLVEVGLGHLALGRTLDTLSGGERQRLRLAGRLGASGAVYVVDEPSAGLHMADIAVLLEVFDRLVDAGNTLVVVDHDTDVVRHADWVIDLGPGAGRHGGRVVFAGTPADLLEVRGSATAEHLRAAVGRAA
jgi:excinuclease UvrABC ATPase subunit